ncbi:hypothetical protein ACOME3_003822 [Neoechinorhynchus agilis]
MANGESLKQIPLETLRFVMEILDPRLVIIPHQSNDTYFVFNFDSLLTGRAVEIWRAKCDKVKPSSVTKPFRIDAVLQRNNTLVINPWWFLLDHNKLPSLRSYFPKVIEIVLVYDEQRGTYRLYEADFEMPCLRDKKFKLLNPNEKRNAMFAEMKAIEYYILAHCNHIVNPVLSKVDIDVWRAILNEELMGQKAIDHGVRKVVDCLLKKVVNRQKANVREYLDQSD